MHRKGHLDDAYWLLRIGLGSSTFLAGLDKFTNLLTDWEKYLTPQFEEKLPVSGKTFMRGVGVIEMLVGLGILSKKTKLASYTASAWLLCIAGDLVINGDYDVAVRDVNMALTAYALARAEGSRQEARSREFMDDDAAFEDVA
ncbi:MAG TPA: hypothetical protein VFR24_18230 [Candidatus Angelobacter sp.]|nr:hypothetical protein [Candidatus Angelobacter sp.]